ncbi:MAG: ribosomal subunit interface protein [Paraglaciecola sp.]|jgi:ribosomal subunit interface protein
MLLHIQSKHFSLSEALNKYVKNKVQIMLGRYEAKIIRVDVTLFDINGPKGGEDKCCRIVARINGASSIIIQETAEDLYDAINTCSRRGRRAVKRQLNIHVRARRKIKEILLLTSKEAEIQNTPT